MATYASGLNLIKTNYTFSGHLGDAPDQVQIIDLNALAAWNVVVVNYVSAETGRDVQIRARCLTPTTMFTVLYQHLSTSGYASETSGGLFHKTRNPSNYPVNVIGSPVSDTDLADGAGYGSGILGPNYNNIYITNVGNDTDYLVGITVISFLS